MKKLKYANLLMVLIFLASLAAGPAQAATPSFPIPAGLARPSGQGQNQAQPTCLALAQPGSKAPAQAQQKTPASLLANTGLPIIDDFESGGVGAWFQYGDYGAGSYINDGVVLTNTLTTPGAISNTVMSVAYNAAGWGLGTGKDLIPAQDWSAYDGLGFWFYGENSGTTFKIILSDNKSGPGDTAERFAVKFTDNFSGWKQLSFPWGVFYRDPDYQPGGAPNDGLTLSEMNAYAFAPLVPSSGKFYLDTVGLFSDAIKTNALTVQFSSRTYSVPEGGTASITATLNVTASYPVTVTYASVDGTALAGVDYTSASGQLVFQPGDLAKTFNLVTLDNTAVNPNKTLSLVLSTPVSVTLGSPMQATVTIVDNDTANPANTLVDSVDDFQRTDLPTGIIPVNVPVGYYTFNAPGASAAITLTTANTAPALPLTALANQALKLDVTVHSGQWAGFVHAFEDLALTQWLTQDWSTHVGVAFWLYGNNTGGTLFLDVLDNRKPGSTSDDAERWSIDIPDNFSGWKYFEIPFSALHRKDVGNGAPNDGLQLTEVHGYGIGAYGSVDMGTQTYYIDNLGIIIRTMGIDDFESGALPSGTIPTNVPVGYYTFNAPSATAAITITTGVTAPGLLAPQAANHALKLSVTVPGGQWAGYVHAFTDAGLTQWLTQDWSTYQGVAFWLYGNNTGGTLFLDVLDNRKPGSTSDDAERWSIDIPDNFSGWKFFQIPFSSLHRKDVGNGAPNDGLTLTSVHGYGIGAYGSVDMGSQIYYIDNVMIYGNTGAGRLLQVGFSPAENKVTEGGTVTIAVDLNFTPAREVQVSYATQDGSARANRHYLPASGTLTFPVGVKETTFTVQTLDDKKWNPNETVELMLSSPVSVTLGLLRQTELTIADNDPFDPALIDDFEGPPYFFSTHGNATLSTTELVSGTAMALPGQGAFENVLQAPYDTLAGPAGFGRTFAQGQDWSSYNGLSFWYYGQGSGDTITVTLQDNRQPDPGASGWNLAWSDEFNGAQGAPVDSKTWTHETGGQGWGNGEMEYYTNSTANSALDGAGSLVITATTVNTATTSLNCWYGPCKYTSARLITEKKFEFAYGRAEARLQIPAGQGIWPAFWMLGDNLRSAGWPTAGEIDIMENIGKEPNTVHGTIHGPGYSGGNGIGHAYSLSSGNFADEYHTFAVEWEPAEIRWYVDGTQFFTATTASLPGGTQWVYDHPFFFILNVAVGGAWPGYPDATSTYPQTMKVDYVRVYQGPDTAERFYAAFKDDFTGWKKVTIPFRHFQRSVQQPAGAPNDGLTLSQVWGYGFELPAGHSGILYLDQVRIAKFPLYLKYFPVAFR